MPSTGRKSSRRSGSWPEYARAEINAIGGYYAFCRELINGDSVFDFDTTKLSIHTLDVGLAGIEVYDILRDEYDIQTEFGDLGNLLAYISVGDRRQDIERLVSALAEIRRRYKKGQGRHADPGIYSASGGGYRPRTPSMRRRSPFRWRRRWDGSAPNLSCAILPASPFWPRGSEVTPQILDYIRYAIEKGCSLTGPEDLDIQRLNVEKGV